MKEFRMKKGKKMLFFILPLCFLSWNGRTFPGCTVHDDATKEHGTGWFFHHFHAYKKISNKKMENHSFYGLPYRLDKD